MKSVTSRKFLTLFQVSEAKIRDESTKVERKVSRGAETPDLQFYHNKNPAIRLLLGSLWADCQKQGRNIQ